MGSCRRSVTLREGLLGYNSDALLMWISLRTYFAEYDFECLKRLWLPSLDTNWFSNEMVKGPSQHFGKCVSGGCHI
jgi:hypothetical protein